MLVLRRGVVTSSRAESYPSRSGLDGDGDVDRRSDIYH
jgi:hypothetical protein